MKNIMVVAIGFIMLAIGAVGLVVPLLPTTPFIIVATACFASNPVLYARVMKIPFVNEYATNYKEHKGISRRTVMISFAFLWIMLIISAVVIGKLWIVLCLMAIGTVVSTHIVIISKPRKLKNKRWSCNKNQK